MKAKVEASKHCGVISKTGHNDITIVGDPIGAYLDGSGYTKDEMIEKIVSASSVSEIETYVRHSIGDYLMIVKSNREKLAYSAPGGHAYYFTIKDKEVIFSDLDGPLTEYVTNIQVDEKALAYRVNSKYSKSYHPLQSLVRGIEKIPTGVCLEVGQNKTKKRIYSGKEVNNLYKTKNSYEDFKRVLEGQSKVICREAERRGRSINTMLSGGVDSTIVTLALNKYHDVTPCTGMPGQFEPVWGFPTSYKEAKAVSREANLDLRVCRQDSTSEELDKAIKESEGISAYQPAHLAQLAVAGFFENEERNKPFVVCGHRMDRVYHVGHAKGNNVIPRSPLGLQTVLEQSIFTDDFLQILANNKSPKKYIYKLVAGINKLLGLPVNEIFPKNKNEYFISVVASDFTKSVVEDKRSKEEEIASSYKQNRNIIKKIIEEVGISTRKCDSVESIRKTLRQLSLLFGSGSQNTYYNAQTFCGGSTRIVFGFQGPMFEFFQFFPLKLKNAIFRKQYYYDYFEDETEKKYRNVVRDSGESIESNNVQKTHRVDHHNKHDTYVSRNIANINKNLESILENVPSHELSSKIRSEFKNMKKLDYEPIDDPREKILKFKKYKYLASTLKSIQSISKLK